MSEGHGAPTLFITLSCAEYYWPDILRLIRNRYECAGLECPAVESTKGKTTLINDFTMIVQEYFQARVDIWLKTIGKKVFDIKHYWLRYEFAPGRGQIHCHMLAIQSNKDMQEKYYDLRGDKSMQALFLEQYLEKKFRMVSMKEEGFVAKEQLKQPHPSSMYFSDVEHKLKEDEYNCLLRNQQHNCTDYCLRRRKFL